MRVTAYFEELPAGGLAVVVPDLLWLEAEAIDVFHVRRAVVAALAAEGIHLEHLKIDLERGFYILPNSRSLPRIDPRFPWPESIDELPMHRKWNYIWGYAFRADLLLGLDPFEPNERDYCNAHAGPKEKFPSAVLASIFHEGCLVDGSALLPVWCS